MLFLGPTSISMVLGAFVVNVCLLPCLFSILKIKPRPWIHAQALCFLLLDIFFIYISNVIPFSDFLDISSPIPSPFLSSIRVFPSLSTSPSHIPQHSPTLGVQPWQDQGLLLPLVPNKSILCYICSWSHGSIHVYSLGSSGWLALLWLWVASPFNSFNPFSHSPNGGPVLSSVVCCWHSPLYWTCSGCVSQERSISGSCQHALLSFISLI